MADLSRLPGLKGRLGRTHRRLRDIAMWRAWWPLVVLTSIFLITALLGAFERAPARLAAFGTLLAFAGMVIAFLRGLRRYRRPQPEEAVRALEAGSELRPISSLQDRPTRLDQQGLKLWKAHEDRLSDAARTLSIPSFWPVWRKIDPLMLRVILPVSLMTLFVLNGPARTYDRLASALSPDYGMLFGADQVRVEAWITPPQHTGRAPIFLTVDDTRLSVPKGSIMTLRAQAPSSPRLRLKTNEGEETQSFEATPDGAFEASVEVRLDTTISVRWWGERQAWRINTTPDEAPSARFVELPKLGENDRTEFSWAVSDDYGVASLALAIKPVDTDREPDLVPMELGSAAPRAAEDEVALDLTRNRWAGARVEVRLRVTDGAGQIGESEPHVFILPERLLLQPVAKAIQDIRVTVLREDDPYQEALGASDVTEAGAYYVSATQRLSQAPAGVQRGAIMIEAVTYEAPRYFQDPLVYSGLTTARYQLETAVTTDEAKVTEPLLWALALRSEYGSSADAYAALMAAKKALEDALRDGAGEEEIKRLMEAFKDAAQRYIAAKMAEAMANGLEPAPDTRDGAEGPSGPGLGGQSFSDMLDALEDLTETGATDQARQLLSDITNMLENLEFQQGEASGEGFPGLPGEEGEENEEDLPQEERELSETMRELSELLREQRELNDETLAQQRGEGTQSGEPSGPSNPDGTQFGEELPDWMQGEEGSDGRTLAERQAELAEELEELGAGQGEDGDGDGPGGELDEDTLDSIERAQRRAADALEGGNEDRAIRNQEQATRQLRELAEGLAEELDALREERLGEGPRADGGDSTDPFGNPAAGAIDDSNTVDIPDEAERQRARDILEELRRRYGETLDEEEREYLERLLDRF